MLCKVLQDFRYSADGYNELKAREGETLDIPDNLVPGLIDAGWLEDAAPAAPATKMQTPLENKAEHPAEPRPRQQPTNHGKRR